MKSIADEFGISEEDLRQANGLRKNEKPNPAEVLYVPDSHNDVTATLLFVRKLQKEELAIAKKGKLLETSEYIVKEGDTLWGISDKFNLDVDTLVGSNQKVLGGNINRLKLENNTALARRHLLQGSLILFRLSPHSRSTQKI